MTVKLDIPALADAAYHRVRFYEKAWSNFDEIKECSGPGPCWGCQYKHPFCDENGCVKQRASE